MINPLTSLRFIFALMVFLFHLPFVREENPVFLNLFYKYFEEGFLGVSFFFILSGFILSLTYNQKIVNKKVSLFNFYLARIARIYPLHIITLIISIPLTLKVFLTDFYMWLFELFLNILLLQSYVPLKEVYFSFNGPSWSISNELFFYLLFPFIVIFYARAKWVKYLYLLIIALLPIIIILYNGSHHYSLFYVNPIFRITDFIVGILLYMLFEKCRNSVISRSYFISSLMEIASIVVFVLFLVFHDYVYIGFRYSCYYWMPMCFVIFIFAFNRGFISSQVLSKKLFILLGEISFSFYLLHTLVTKYYSYINNKLQIITNDYISMSILLVITLIASYLTHRFIEKPANQYIKNRFTRQSV